MAKKKPQKDVLFRMFMLESNKLTIEQTIEFFQDLIDSDIVWKLPAPYGEQASYFIKNGHCTPKKIKTEKN